RQGPGDTHGCECAFHQSQYPRPAIRLQLRGRHHGPGRTVYIAGQLGLDMENKLVGAPGDFRAQAIKAIENLQAALASVGAKLTDVVKITNYLTDIASQIGVYREIRDQFFPMPRPASTAVGISQLARPGALFEIE